MSSTFEAVAVSAVAAVAAVALTLRPAWTTAGEKAAVKRE